MKIQNKVRKVILSINVADVDHMRVLSYDGISLSDKCNIIMLICTKRVLVYIAAHLVWIFILVSTKLLYKKSELNENNYVDV
jgi:hypothetical protein